MHPKTRGIWVLKRSKDGSISNIVAITVPNFMARDFSKLEMNAINDCTVFSALSTAYSAITEGCISLFHMPKERVTLEPISKKSECPWLCCEVAQNAHILRVCSAFSPLRALPGTLILFFGLGSRMSHGFVLSNVAPAASRQAAMRANHSDRKLFPFLIGLNP